MNIFIFKTFFYWRLVAFQRCVSFGCTMKRIGPMHACVPSLLDLRPPYPNSSPLGHHRALSRLPVL